ncbi:Os03g0569700 [Oryza sativa Japonica Group]|uniref:Os03g0569700 protein n=1 Tax=Oryza sativa subsp. japonica TaxID=39947 RepID=A0A0N7KHJ3_ORYSJ|nr:Os03g0569700 [Oryza sativa Japonica Group]
MPLDDYWPAAVAVAVAGNGMATAPSLTTTTTTLSGLPPRLSMSRPRPDAANHWRSSSPRRLVPARSHPSSMASLSPATTDAEQSANVAATNLPWLDLGHANPFAMMDHYAGVLDELRWSDYFDGAYQNNYHDNSMISSMLGNHGGVAFLTSASSSTLIPAHNANLSSASTLELLEWLWSLLAMQDGTRVRMVVDDDRSSWRRRCGAAMRPVARTATRPVPHDG